MNGHKRLFLPTSLSAFCWLVPSLAELIGQHPSLTLWCLLESKPPWPVCLESLLRLGQEKPAWNPSQ